MTYLIAIASILVIDGDTLRIGDERIRIMGLDTPETHRARCMGEYTLGAQATRKMANLVRQGVTIERGGIDRYGRTLAVVRVNGRDVAVTMIGAGLARAYHGGKREGWCQ